MSVAHTPALLHSVPALDTLELVLTRFIVTRVLPTIDSSRLVRLRSLQLSIGYFSPAVGVPSELCTFLRNLPALEHFCPHNCISRHLPALLSSIATPLRTLKLDAWLPGQSEPSLGSVLRQVAAFRAVQQLDSWTVEILVAGPKRWVADKVWEDDDWQAWLEGCEKRGAKVVVDIE